MKIKICNSEYDLEFINQDSDVFEDRKCNGVCKNRDNKIFIADNIPEGRKQEIVIHELFHALVNEANYGNILSDRMVEFYEPFVEAMQKPLYSLIKDNDMKEILK